MLVRLLPDQIADYWELIKESINRSAYPLNELDSDKMNRILESLLVEKMQCWASVRVKDEVTTIVAIATTTVIIDLWSNEKSLLIYSTYATEQTKKEDWMDAFATVSKFAKGKGCDKVIAYARDDSDILKIAEKFDADMSQRLLSFSI